MQAELYSRDGSNMWLIIFDLWYSGIAERLHREQTGWKGFADVAMRDPAPSVLVIRPGGAERAAT